MYYIVEQGLHILWFLLSPVAGELLLKYSSRANIKTLLISSALLFSPILIGYSYTFPYFNEILFFVILSTSYTFIVQLINPQTKITIFVVSVFGLFGLACLSKIAGTITVEEKWEFENYKIEYKKDQGFSGGPLYTYKLSRYTNVPIYIKELEIKVAIKDTLEGCSINFPENQLTFDKCVHNDGRPALTIENR
ncbi:hypothetical protein [Pedobacter sp. Leaf176]|uniref:hypothetical protein n=1 Tax=Pedobacter sp. Leaf176 TaxID=1736286 RepID=UPI0007017F9D|nr:hypothetical protein [Pedobacter sp. Leaf176]KQR68209.1 hypothetical protein ASF92_15165 [Pedobacter sp. Leaf176]